jgi:hypothetical protein
LTTDVYDNSISYSLSSQNNLCRTTINVVTECFERIGPSIEACYSEVGLRNRPITCLYVSNFANNTICNCPYLDANIVCGKYYCNTFDTGCFRQNILDYGGSPIGNCITAPTSSVYTNHFPYCRYTSDTIRQCIRNPARLAAINSCIANATTMIYGTRTCAETVDLRLACYQTHCPLHDSRCLRSSMISTECSVLDECTSVLRMANSPIACATETNLTAPCACTLVDSVTVCGAQLCNPLDLDCLNPRTANFSLAVSTCASQRVNTTVFRNHSPYCNYTNRVIQSCNTTLRANISNCYSNIFANNIGRNCSYIATLQRACFQSTCPEFDLNCANIQPDCSGVT